MQYDVAIIGGGPAGAATALSLRRHDPALSVVIVEGTSYQKARIGESLHPIARPLLEHLGVWNRFAEQGHQEALGTSAVWGTDERHENEFLYSRYGRGWHLDRRRFDSMLAAEAEKAGAALVKGARVGDTLRTPAGWRLNRRAKKGGMEPLEARFVVDATGRTAVFAHQRGAGRIAFDRMLGLFVFFAHHPDGETDPYTLVEAWEEGWWYSAHLPERRLVVALMSDADRVKTHSLSSPERWFGFLNQSTHTRRRVQGARPLTQPAVRAAHTQRLDRMTGPGWLAVGDAASTFDPLSSQGLFKALRSGIHASYAISDHLAGRQGALDRYEAGISMDFESYLVSRREYYRQELRWPDSPFWQRRFGHVHLDPGQRLRAIAAKKETPAPKSTLLLSAADLQRILALCRRPRPAHEVVSELNTGRQTPLPSERIILTLQNLLEEGLLFEDPRPD